MQTTAIGTVANSLPENEVILLTLLISKGDILFAELRNIYDFSTISPTKSAYHFPSFCYREKMICALRYSKGADNVCLDGKLAQYVYQFSFDRFVVLDGLGERYIDDFIVIDTNHDVALPFHNGVNGSGA